MRRVFEKKPVRFLLEIAQVYFSRRVSRSAAELAYFLVLSFFPLLICVNAFIGLLDVDVTALLSIPAPFLPRAAMSILSDYVQYITENQSPALLAAGVVMTLISASAAFRALMNIMADVYGCRRYRGVGQVIASVFFSAGFLAVIYLSIAALFTGGRLFRLLGRALGLDGAPLRWDWLRFPLLFLLVFLFVLLVYRVAAPTERPRPPVLAGAALASVALAGASALFSWFIGMSSRYSLVYGSLASVIILLVWLYLCGNILILGSVFNHVRYQYKKSGHGGR